MTLSVRRELARKGLHLISVVVPIAYAAGIPRVALIAVLAAAAIAALAIELARSRHEGVRAHFHGLLGHLLREHELARWSGATWLVLALLGLALFTPREVAIAGMWALAVGDAAAALAGRTLGPRRGATGRKTAIGSAACFATTLLGALLVAHLAAAEGVVAATSATAAEWPRSRVDDNVRIAVAVSAGILLWRMAFS